MKNQNEKKMPNVKYVLAAAISFLTFVVYLPSLRNDFVNWDDSQYVTENPFIRSVDLAFFKWAFFDFYASNWHPLTWISHALDYAVWGLNPMGHHLTNNILHAANTFLVVLLVVRLMEIVTNHPSPPPSPPRGEGNSICRGAGPAPSEVEGGKGLHDSRFTIHHSRFVLITAGVTGLLFGLHPIHVESVAWVAERKDLLCAFFYLLSVMSYIKYAKAVSWSPVPGSHSLFTIHFSRPFISALCFFILALLSKPMAVSLPLVLLILDWYPFKRIQSLKTLLASVIGKLPFIALSLASSIVTIMAQKTGGAIELMGSRPLSTKALVAANSLLTYLWKMVLPVNLIPLYPYPENVSLQSPEYFLPIVLIAGFTIACLLAVKKQKLWLSCWGYFLITMGPVLGIVQVGYQARADRYTYLPGIGPFLLAGLSIAWLASSGNASKKRGFMFNLFAGAAAILLIASMSYATLKQTGIWKNSVDLWTYVIEKEPLSSEIVYDNRGSAFNDLGQFDRAIEDFSKAIALNPSFALAYRNRGTAFSNMGLLDKAIKDLDKAITLEPSASAYYARGVFFEREGQPDKAIGDYEQAIALNPSYGSAYFSLGVLYGKSGRIEKAIDSFDKSIDISPNHSLAYGNRGLAYSLTGQYDKAVKDLDRAIELNKRYAGAYGNRGNIYLKFGKREFALRDFETACKLGDKDACNVISSLQR